MTVEDTGGYGTPHPPKSNLMRKRVGGVPVVYLAGGVVLILVVYSYKAKSTTTKAADKASATDTSTLGGDVYPAMPQGTVIVAPAVTAPNGPSNSAIETNDQWLRAGVALLIKAGNGPGTAQEALQAYLNGDHLSYQQGAMRDRVISELGLPPYPPDSGGTDPKTVDPTTTTVPVVPLPSPPVVPPVNTPVPVRDNGYVSPYTGQTRNEIYMTGVRTSAPSDASYGELGNPYDYTMGMSAPQRRAALLQSGEDPSKVWINYPDLPMMSSAPADNPYVSLSQHQGVSSQLNSAGQLEYRLSNSGPWFSNPRGY